MHKVRKTSAVHLTLADQTVGDRNSRAWDICAHTDLRLNGGRFIFSVWGKLNISSVIGSNDSGIQSGRLIF